jgi:hypothetical protein
MTDRYNLSTLLNVFSLTTGTYLAASLKVDGVIHLPWLVIFAPALIYTVLLITTFLLLLHLVNNKPFPHV